MNCPEHLILDARFVMIWHHQRADIRREFVTWGEVLNPLRYEVCIGSGPGKYFHVNDSAKALRWLQNRTFHIRKLCWLRGHDWRELNSFQEPTMICDRCFKTRPAEFD